MKTVVEIGPGLAPMDRTLLNVKRKSDRLHIHVPSHIGRKYRDVDFDVKQPMNQKNFFCVFLYASKIFALSKIPKKSYLCSIGGVFKK